MNIALQLQELLESKGVSRSKLAREIGVHTSTVSNWLEGKDVKSENLATLCSYFNCSLDYLTGTIEEKQKTPILTKKDERDIAKKLDEMLGQLGGSDEALMFDGEPLDDETRELLRASLKNQLEMTKRMAKQRYTPKKYKG